MDSFFTDTTLDGLLGILNYKYGYKMDFANKKFLVGARKKDYNQNFISFVMRLRIQGKSRLDLDSIKSHSPFALGDNPCSTNTKVHSLFLWIPW